MLLTPRRDWAETRAIGRKASLQPQLIQSSHRPDDADKVTPSPEQYDYRRSGSPSPRTLLNWIQHDDWYLAIGLQLIVGVGRPKFERLFPKSEAFLARRRPCPRVHLLGSDLYFDVGVSEDVAIPPWVLGRASL